MRGVIGAVAALVLIGCAPVPNTDSAMSGSALLPSVQAALAGDSVHFVFQVTNTSSDPVEMTFTSGQSFDFSVRTTAGESVWTWSADKSFIQVIREESLGAGETLAFEASWPSEGAAPGDYVVEATLTTADHEVRQSTTFRLP